MEALPSSQSISANTLPFQIQQSFASVLNGEDLSEMLAKASTVNNQMVEMMGAFRREQAHKSVNGLNIALRETK